MLPFLSPAPRVSERVFLGGSRSDWGGVQERERQLSLALISLLLPHLPGTTANQHACTESEPGGAIWGWVGVHIKGLGMKRVGWGCTMEGCMELGGAMRG